MKEKEIVNIINNLKETHSQIQKNCFLRFSSNSENEWEAYGSSKSLCIVINDNDVERMYFYTIDFDDLNSVINNYLKNRNLVVEILGKDMSMYRIQLEDMGFIFYKSLSRYCNNNISDIISQIKNEFSSSCVSEYADESELEQVDTLLNKTFDSKVSHLDTKENLEKSIKEKQILIHKDENLNIDALLKAVVTPKCFYINQIINLNEKRIIHSILTKQLLIYESNGGKYVYSWIADDNYASIRFHAKFGLKKDNLLNAIYIKKR